MLVGFLLPSAQSSVFGALTDHLELELRSHGYQVLIVHSRNDPEAEPLLISSLYARGIDGLIWIPSQDKVDPVEMGLKPDLPAVILDRPRCTGKLPFVATDNRAAAREFARRIYDIGHRRIGVLNAPEGDRSMRERFQGIKDVFERGIRTVDIPNDASHAKEAVAELLSGGSKSSVIVALSEPLAIGALAGLRDLNWQLPDDISFAAFDDFPLAGHWSPRITVVCQDIPLLASSAVNLLLERIKSPSAHFADIRVKSTIEWRDSVTSPKGAPR
jgi:LacI family transcriptional regulator